MITLLPNQALQRWDALPETLRDAIFSEANSDFIWKTGEAEHIPDEKIYDISRVVGYVLLGFLHPEDLAEEIKTRANINPQTAQTIQDAINKRIFAPLRADIDKVYQPISKLEDAASPKIIQDIGSMSMTPPAPPTPPTAPAKSGPQTTSQSFTGSLTVGASPASGMPAIPPSPPKSSLTDKGWSKISPNDPVVRLAPNQPLPQSSKPPTAAPQPQQPQQNFQQKPAASMGMGGEFERLSKAPSAPGAVPQMPAPQSAPKPPVASGPAPMMLHEDPQIKSIQSSSDFRFSPSGQSEIAMGASKSQSPLKAALLELGKSAAPTAPSSASKVVHYTEFGKAPSSSGVPQSGGPARNVIEITAAPAPQAPAPQKPGFASVPVPIPPPPKASAAPQPPTPPPAQSAQGSTVIKKDYL